MSRVHEPCVAAPAAARGHAAKAFAEFLIGELQQAGFA